MYSHKCKENDSKAVNLRISIIPREEDGKKTFKKNYRTKQENTFMSKKGDRLGFELPLV